jgi:hypothetical protein
LQELIGETVDLEELCRREVLKGSQNQEEKARLICGEEMEDWQI